MSEYTVTAPLGLVGRLVMTEVSRGDKKAEEACEVVACQTGGEYGSWRILVATSDGYLLEKVSSSVRLVATPDGGGPYR